MDPTRIVAPSPPSRRTCVHTDATPTVTPNDAPTLHTLSRDDAMEAAALVVQSRARARSSALRNAEAAPTVEA